MTADVGSSTDSPPVRARAISSLSPDDGQELRKGIAMKRGKGIAMKRCLAVLAVALVVVALGLSWTGPGAADPPAAILDGHARLAWDPLVRTEDALSPHAKNTLPCGSFAVCGATKGLDSGLVAAAGADEPRVAWEPAGESAGPVWPAVVLLLVLGAATALAHHVSAIAVSRWKAGHATGKPWTTRAGQQLVTV